MNQSNLWFIKIKKKNTPYKYKPLQINIKFTATNDLTQPLKMTSEMVESASANIRFSLYQLDLDIRRLVGRPECLHLNIFKK